VEVYYIAAYLNPDLNTQKVTNNIWYFAIAANKKYGNHQNLITIQMILTHTYLINYRQIRNLLTLNN